MDFKIDPRTLISPQTQPVTGRKQRDLQSLRESSRDFETLYVMEMFKAMRKSVPNDGLFKKEMATEVFQEMLDMETAREVTRGPGIGIAEAIYRQMSPLVENKK